MRKQVLLLTLLALVTLAGMTKNGLRLPCMCHKCNGASRDYRTVQNHTARDIADRPLFPPLFPVNHVLEDPPLPVAPDPPLPAVHDGPEPDQPYPDVPLEDMVSHVEAMENCNEPVYETVI